jgi:hypothetical protein
MNGESYHLRQAWSRRRKNDKPASEPSATAEVVDPDTGEVAFLTTPIQTATRKERKLQRLPIPLPNWLHFAPH